MTRAAVFQHVRLGAEVTPGTPVAANKRLLNTRFNIDPQVPADPFRPVGSKFATDLSLQKEWSAGSFEGSVGYNDLAYILSSVLGVPSAPAGGGTAKTWTFTCNAWAPDIIQTYTFNYGSTDRAEGCNFGFFTGIEFNFARNGATYRGDVIGSNLTEGVTMVSATDVASVLAWPKKTSILVGDSIGGLTALTRCVAATYALRGKIGPAFFLRDDTDSYDDTVEMAPDNTASIQVEHNSTASGLMADLRTAKQKFARFKVTGPEVATGVNSSLQITFPFKLQQPARGDADGIFASTFALVPDYESVFGGAVEIVIVNSIGAL